MIGGFSPGRNVGSWTQAGAATPYSYRESMGSTIDQNSSHVGTSQPDTQTVLGYFGTAGTVVSTAIAVYEFLQKLDGDPIVEALDQVLEDLSKIMTKVDLQQIITDADKVRPLAHQIDLAANALKTFAISDSPANRTTAANNFRENGGLHVGLIGLFAGYDSYFIPSVYKVDGKLPGWSKGRTMTYLSYLGDGPMGVSDFFTNDFYQVYEQTGQPLAEYWNVPDPLRQNATRWDGRVCLPLIEEALQTWEAGMLALEPFYPLTGQWAPLITMIADKMDSFESHWVTSLLWPREMPSKAEIKQHVGSFIEPDPTDYHSGSGFTTWPLGVLDPITGIERVNLTWWKADQEDHVVELWTEDQRIKFVNERETRLQELKQVCGLFAFQQRKNKVRKLLVPPSASPSMEPHPELRHYQYLSAGNPAVIGHGQQVTVIDQLGQPMSGHYARTSVKATGPFSVQSKPAPESPNHPRRAESDVELGYQIRVIPKGASNPPQGPAWVWHLRYNRDDPVTSLYHLADGSPRPIPEATSKTFKGMAETWETITDGTKRDRRDVKADSPIVFKMTATIADMQPLESMEPKLIQSDVDGRTRRGALWITIEADKDTNLGRSFEVEVELTETAAVDTQGNIGKPEAANKKYTSKLTFPVDICRIYVPSSYFVTPDKGLGALHKDGKHMGIPVPEPDPDPILELSLWRVILEREPVLLQRYVHRQREAAGRPTLTAQQALEDIDRVLKHASAPRVARATARVPGAVTAIDRLTPEVRQDQ
jgi:hypothetical protein